MSTAHRLPEARAWCTISRCRPRERHRRRLAGIASDVRAGQAHFSRSNVKAGVRLDVGDAAFPCTVITHFSGMGMLPGWVRSGTKPSSAGPSAAVKPLARPPLRW